MSSYTQVNLEQVPDIAPQFGMDDMGEARFARQALGAQRIGMAFYRMKPGRRLGFGHHHETSEEMYLVLSGSLRFRAGEEIAQLGPRDVVYIGPATMREWEAGPEGAELVAFGAHAEDEQHTQEMGWWPR